MDSRAEVAEGDKQGPRLESKLVGLEGEMHLIGDLKKRGTKTFWNDRRCRLNYFPN
jgi:hypothetical protein